MKLNISKSVDIDFTNRNILCNPVYKFDMLVPYSNTAKYLSITLDAKLQWGEHVKIKIVESRLKWKKLHWLLGTKKFGT